MPSWVERIVAGGPADNLWETAGGRLRFPIRLTSNCNAYGPSERVSNAMQAVAKAAYLDPAKHRARARERIAGEHRVTRDGVVLAGGSSRILRMAVSAAIEPGQTLITAQPTFDVIGRYAQSVNRQVVSVPLNSDHSHDLDAMLSRCDATTGLVYICNPNNPTGTLTRRRDLESFIAKLPASTLVIIDEAYHHYVDDASDYQSFLDHPIDDSRVIVARSFSKIHGLAPLRVGYAVARPQVAARLEAHRMSEGVDVMATSAAMAALGDVEYVRASRIRNTDDRQEFFNQANARMVRWIDSQTNFVMLNAERPAGEVVEHFKRNRILLPSPFPRFDRYVRVSLGRAAEMHEFWRVWGLMPGGGHHMSHH
jgi:histidinol-phosphate aminotransferase